MSSSHSQHEQPDRSLDGWTQCPKGTIGELSSQLGQQQELASVQQRRKLVLTACASMGVIALAGTSILLLDDDSGKNNHQDHNIGGITCSEVKRNAIAFRDGSLDKETAARIRLHLEKCSFCKNAMEQATV